MIKKMCEPFISLCIPPTPPHTVLAASHWASYVTFATLVYLISKVHSAPSRAARPTWEPYTQSLGPDHDLFLQVSETVVCDLEDVKEDVWHGVA